MIDVEMLKRLGWSEELIGATRLVADQVTDPLAGGTTDEIDGAFALTQVTETIEISACPVVALEAL